MNTTACKRFSSLGLILTPRRCCVSDVFGIRYSIGILLDAGKSPPYATNGQFSDINFDHVGIAGIDVRHTQPYGVFFSNLNLATDAVVAGISPASPVAIRGKLLMFFEKDRASAN